MDPLVRAWLQLCVLIVVSTIVAQFSGVLATAILVTAAFFKGRIILGAYLHLSTAPAWLTAASTILGIWLVLIAGLYMI